MKSQKHIWTVVLMVSSVLLLLVLQLLWLRSAYNDEVDSFRKETNGLFRSTILALQDSLILKTMEPVTGDSTIVRKHADGGEREFWNSRIQKDSLMLKLPIEAGRSVQYRVKDSATQIQIFVSSQVGDDSIKHVLRPIVSEFRRNRQPGNFIFRMNADTLRVKNIERTFQDTLIKSGILIVPRVMRLKYDEHDDSSTNEFRTDPFYLPRGNLFIASFGNINSKMLAGISAEILFSIVLTALVVTAFFLMYNTLQSQQKLVQLKNDLISNITHELKTPVATVSVALEALKNFKALDNPTLTHEYLDIAQSELNRLTLITDKILKTAVFEENGLALNTESVALDTIIQQVLTTLKLSFEKEKTEVAFHKEGDSFSVNGNAEHLTNVIYNLIDNAMKYGKSPHKIDIQLKNENKRVILLVADNGIGIPSEYKHKIFEKFFRVPTGDVHNAKGYGLGLSYVASVVKAHHGKISVESEIGKGSKFRIDIPAP